ncbi:MAG TPA: MBL fold metallo-hydrolase [Bryobacteraceae bacterium]|nr:MBL fold metallo-hydrolase [Bryobacteraceae bacterium]
MKISALLFWAMLVVPVALPAQALDVYVIDVEGGKSVLTVAPSGESMLFDAGWPGFNGRDVNRIVEAAKAAGLKQIDYLVISHYDIDHLGDVPLLVSTFPVKHIIDHGPLQSSGKGAEARYQAYAEARDKIDHTAVKPGDRIPIKGVDVQVLTAATKMITSPLPGAGAANPLCDSTPEKPELTQDLEDNMSVGLLFTLGKFRMLDLADLEWFYDRKLMCPVNRIGTVDVYQVSIHGQDKGVSPALAQALHARVAIMGNGPRKGGAPQTWQTLRGAPGLEDIWQVHYSLLGTKETNPPDDYIANPDTACQGKWIKLSARPDGGFTVTNSRNGFSKTYPPRN